jgi:threonine dehydratase
MKDTTSHAVDAGEPAGAASTAALLQSSTGCGDHVVLVVSGANISREVLKRAIGNA